MGTTRRDFLTTAAGAAGAAAAGVGHAHGQEQEHTTVPSDMTLRVKALESLLVEKGYVDPQALDAVVDTYENRLGPHIGAQIVARAWSDAGFKQRLLADSNAAIEEMGFGGQQGERMVAVENTPQVHNVIVCTLCSCYPWSVLGLPPSWYKSTAYRSRTVIDPRGVLKELGLELPENIEVRVWDSTADLRYIVLPERPAGTENLSQEELAALVTRDSMIGVAKIEAPQGGQAQGGRQ